MGRKREDIFTRVARHTGLTRETLIEFLDDQQPECLIWNGAFNPTTRNYKNAPRPYLKGIGNPVRRLFAYVREIDDLDPFVWLRNGCGSFGCINPRHHRVIRAFSMYHNRIGILPLSPDEQREDNIKGIMEMLREGESVDGIREYCSPNEFDEALRRYAQAG